MPMTLEELRKLRKSKKEEMRQREADGKEIQIIVGMGTCGIAAGAKVTLDAFTGALNEKNLKVLIRQTGCMGLCHSEPTVEVIVPGMPSVIYGMVDANVAKGIVNRHIQGHELLNNLILNKPAADIMKE